jgi:hypothetical protein
MVMPKVLFESTYRRLADIPNEEGFRLAVRDHRGRWHAATVVRGDDQCHRLSLPDGIEWNDLRGWVPAPQVCSHVGLGVPPPADPIT